MVFSWTIFAVVSVDYKLLKFERCFTSNDKILAKKTCSATETAITVQLDVKQNLTKIFVT